MTHPRAPRVPPLTSSLQPAPLSHPQDSTASDIRNREAAGDRASTASGTPSASARIPADLDTDDGISPPLYEHAETPPPPAWAAPAEIALDRLLPERRAHLGRSLGPLLGAMALHRRAMLAETVLPPAEAGRRGGDVGDGSDPDDVPDPIDDPAMLDWLAMKEQEEPPRMGPPVPLAATLTPEEIVAMVDRGEDPHAIDSATGLARPPYAVDARQVLLLARICATFCDQDGIDRCLGDGGAVAILCADEAEMAALAEVIRVAVRATPMKIGTRRPLPPLRPQIVSLLPSASGARNSTPDQAVKGLSSPRPLVVLATDPAYLTGALAQLPVMTLAPVDAEVLLFTLREVATGTGQMDDDAVRAALPGDARLARLPTDSLLLAFRSPGPIAAAGRIAELVLTPPFAQATQDGPALADLPGLGAAGLELARIVDDITAYRAGNLPWADVANGVLLIGPPGTGKTTVAEALATSIGVPYFATSLADLQEEAGRGSYVLTAMRQLFTDARQAAKESGAAVIFIDEIDSLPSRGNRPDHNSSYFTNVLNGLLTLLDGKVPRDGVLVVGATNHPERLDPGLIRPGRLGLHVTLGTPGTRGLPDVLRYHLRNALAGHSLDRIARAVAGLTMVEIAALVQSARQMARHKGRPVTEDDLFAALARLRMPVPATLRRRAAVHAAGRAIAAHVTGTARVDRVGLTAGASEVRLTPRPDARTRADITRDLITLLAGTAAEQAILGTPSGLGGGGPDSDLARATHLAIAEDLGLGRNGSLAWCGNDVDPAVLFARHRGLRERIDRRLDAAYARAMSLVRAHMDVVGMVVADLLTDGVLEGDALWEVLGCAPAPREDRGDDGMPSFDWPGV